MKAVIGTCVIIDALQRREPFRKAAEDIFLAVSNRQFTGIITAKSATDIYYIVRRGLHSESEARKVMHTLFNLFCIEDTFAIDCQTAVSSAMPDYEDAVMSQTAQRLGADYIITRNIKDYEHSPVPAAEPQEFIDILKSETEKRQ